MPGALEARVRQREREGGQPLFHLQTGVHKVLKNRLGTYASQNKEGLTKTMRRLIDNSYLHGVGQCLHAEADHHDDLTNFIRFVAEVIIAEHVVFIAREDGPVCPISKSIGDEINDLLDDQFVRYRPRAEFDRREYVQKVAEEIATELRFLRVDQEVLEGRLEPHFYEGSNPDLDYHQFLKDPGRERVTEISDHKSSIGPILTEPQVQDSLSRYLERHSSWTRDATVAVTAAIRMLYYEVISRRVECSYLPAAGRARVNLLPTGARTYLPDIDIKALTHEQDHGIVQRIVLALIKMGRGDPTQILSMAAEVREETTDLRSVFQSELVVDSLHYEHAELRNRLQSVLNAELGESETPSLLSSVEPSIVFPGLPAINIDAKKLKQWINYKRDRQKIKVLTGYLKDSKGLTLAPYVRRLKVHSGLRE